MPEANNIDIEVYLLIGIFAVCILIILLYGLGHFINDFSRELKYLNCEIGRTRGSERRRWKRRRRKLWLSLLPFVKY